jgi:subtilisin
VTTGQPATTGRSVVVFSDGVRGDREAIARALRSLAGITSVIGTADARTGALDPDEAANAEAIAFDVLGLAVIARDPSALPRTVAAEGAPSGPIVAVEPERFLYAIEAQEPAVGQPVVDDEAFTWGLRATAVDTTTATGGGVRVAVLDTGLDLEHPDFAGRMITSRSFVAGEPVHDGQGHGTHTTGTACGPADPPQGRRYGVASQAEIFAGKVLNDAGSGTDASILAGIDWAITNGCRVISMSLGADIRAVSTAYDTVGRRALGAGTLIVAAAGNNAGRRFGDLGFVGVPANSPSIMAVAAVDSGLRIADFSAASNPVQGGAIDIAGPGVDVYSSWRMPRRYNTISGTSMAAPHVAAIAALWSQSGETTGQALWDALVQAARALDLPASDVGAGLAQAPGAGPASPGVMAAMRRRVTVTVADSHAGELEAVAAGLRAAGLDVEQVLAALGVITGAVDASRLGEIAVVPGVAAVEEQRSIQIAPPDADVQ